MARIARRAAADERKIEPPNGSFPARLDAGN